jgi:hypothetical protein
MIHIIVNYNHFSLEHNANQGFMSYIINIISTY